MNNRFGLLLAARILLTISTAACAPQPRVAADRAPASAALMMADATCSATCVDVALKVVFDRLGAATLNPDAQYFDRQNPAASPAYFMQNLRTLANEVSDVGGMNVRVQQGSEFMAMINGAQALKWDVMLAYLGTTLEKTWPSIRWISGAPGSILIGIATPATVGYGSSFEYCEPSTNPARIRRAQAYIRHMISAYEPAEFKVIVRRPLNGRTCGAVMASYLATNVS